MAANTEKTPKIAFQKAGPSLYTDEPWQTFQQTAEYRPVNVDAILVHMIYCDLQIRMINSFEKSNVWLCKVPAIKLYNWWTIAPYTVSSLFWCGSFLCYSHDRNWDTCTFILTFNKITIVCNYLVRVSGYQPTVGQSWQNTKGWPCDELAVGWQPTSTEG